MADQLGKATHTYIMPTAVEGGEMVDWDYCADQTVGNLLDKNKTLYYW